MNLVPGTSQIERIEDVSALEGGGRRYTVRGRIWGHLPCQVRWGSTRVMAGGEERQAPPAPNAGPPAEGRERIYGIASSTGVDSWWTEMSENALNNMAEQFRGELSDDDGERDNREGHGPGVPYAPTHSEREWGEVVGVTVDALVRSVDSVDNAADDTEPAFVLDVWSDIKRAHPRGAQLLNALAEGDVDIGQSIGGWFRKLIIIEDEDGWVDRVIIDLVDLDHLAGTRTPSNGDSTGLQLVRDSVTAAMTEIRTQHRAGLDQRHLFAVAETENTVVWQILKGGALSDDVTDDEVIEDGVIVAEVTEGGGDAERAEHCTTDGDCTGGETCQEGVCRNIAVAEERQRTLDEAAAQAATRSTTSTGADAPPTSQDAAPAVVTPPNVRENEMDEATLANMLADAVAPLTEQTVALAARMEALENGGSNDANRINTDAAAEAEVAAAATAEQTRIDAAVAERTAELEAAVTSLEADRVRDNDLVGRVIDRSLRRAVAPEDRETVAAAMAVADGDFGDLIARTKEEGKAPVLCRVSENSALLKRVRDHEEYTGGKLGGTSMRQCLTLLCRAAEADGIVVEPKQKTASWR